MMSSASQKAASAASLRRDDLARVEEDARRMAPAKKTKAPRRRAKSALGVGSSYGPSPILATPPPPGRARELWLQHAAGAILVAHVRDYAITNLRANLDEKTRVAATQSINQALYGVMMVADGVSGGFRNERCRVSVSMAVTLEQEDAAPFALTFERRLAARRSRCGDLARW